MAAGLEGGELEFIPLSSPPSHVTRHMTGLSVSSRCASPKVVHVHFNYVYKTCSMHQYELVLLPPNFHLSSYFEPH